jgi:Mg2+/Co2+ transporter CorB
MTVDDVKIPRSEIVGIDLDDDWSNVLSILRTSEHNRLPLFRETIDNVLGILHIRKVLHLLAQESLSPQTLVDCADEVYFIPGGTPLNVQLLNFRKEKTRIGLIVDEYGDIEGLITLEDILEEIVGEFTTNLGSSYDNIQLQKDGSYLLDGSINIRDLNRRLKCSLPTEGPNTISGLIIETLETIPENLVCLKIDNYLMEVMEMEDTLVTWVKLTLQPKDSEVNKEEKTT